MNFGTLKRLSVASICSVYGLITTPALAGQFQSADGPKGGEAVVGELDGQRDAQSALASMLRLVHQHFHARPNLTSVVNNKRAQNISGFFSESWNGAPVSGLAIVSYANLRAPLGIVVYDSAQRFPQSVRSLVQLAQQRAHAMVQSQAPAPGGGDAGGDLAPAAPLRQTRFPDGSGSIGLPEGWRIMTAYQGGVITVGPHKEWLAVGNFFPVIDTGTPYGARQAQMYMSMGRGLPGRTVAFPYTNDPGRAYASVMSQKPDGGRSPSFNNIKVAKSIRDQMGETSLITGTIDKHDGAGVRSFLARVTIGPRQPRGFNVMISHVQIPMPFVRTEYKTALAMFKSHSMNERVIHQETAAAIGEIEMIGARARANAARSNAETDARSAAFTQHMSDIDRQSAGFSDYILENSVVSTQSGNTTYHARMSNDWANELVRQDPQNFEILPTSRYMQGVDY